MTEVIAELLKELVAFIRDWRNPQTRKELLELAKAKYSDNALLLCNEMIQLAVRQQSIDTELKLLHLTTSRNDEWIKKVRILNKKKYSLWERFNKKDNKLRKLLIKE